ncbi:probable disease resistance protein RPP1 [Raphanus sativus]|uniref:Probable disease resistance protein RPP1 n=1 Tax=Raphanus sativus TaxID=3726 RepID=A0A6J0M035_RAPSA|nr:probable disease resistance protein RPP1 [Raphanus sativus]
MKFDVFVSFRGIDTRRTFVSHLFLALFKEQFKTFKQEEEIPLNQPASSQVIEAIENSEIAIVVISKNYTASVSCLDELAKITECWKKQSLVVAPVFYEVDPSDVLGQASNLGEDNDGGNSNNLEKVERWRNALASLVDIYQEVYSSQWEDGGSSEDEDTDASTISRLMSHVSELLRPHVQMSAVKGKSDPTGVATSRMELVRDALRRIAWRIMNAQTLNSFKPTTPARSITYYQSQLAPPSIDFNSLVGMDRQMKEVEALLLSMDSIDDDGLGEMGIWGDQILVGKTTLARCVYQKISPQFQDHYYYFEKNSQNSARGIDSTCLLEEITRAAALATSLAPDSSLFEVVNANLGHRKVLLIVDFSGIGQLENIRKIASRFGPGSRLIFVTQGNYDLLRCGIKHLYEVETLRYDEALQLFSQYAFKREHVPREYYRLSVRAVLITGRIPLALKVFGSFLHGKVISEWEFELCRLEASQVNWVANVSSYIGNALS